MAYVDDINRSRDVDAEGRTRVNAENWRVLNDFRFESDPAEIRLERLLSSYAIILLWMMIFTLAGFLGARRLPEVDHG
jgi:ABC-2 type transport system permease protein